MFWSVQHSQKLSRPRLPPPGTGSDITPYKTHRHDKDQDDIYLQCKNLDMNGDFCFVLKSSYKAKVICRQ